jgi:DNA primase
MITPQLPLSFLELADLIDRGPLGKQIQLRRISRNRFRGFCPFHHDARNPNFDVYELRPGEKGRFYCQNCEAKGDAIEWRMRMEQKSFQEAGGRSLDRRAVEQRDREKASQRRRESILGAYHDRWPDCCCPEWLLDTGASYDRSAAQHTTRHSPGDRSA